MLEAYFNSELFFLHLANSTLHVHVWLSTGDQVTSLGQVTSQLLSMAAGAGGAFLLSLRNKSSLFTLANLLYRCTNQLFAVVFVIVFVVRKSNHQAITWKGPLGLMSKNAFFQSGPWWPDFVHITESTEAMLLTLRSTLRVPVKYTHAQHRHVLILTVRKEHNWMTVQWMHYA